LQTVVNFHLFVYLYQNLIMNIIAFFLPVIIVCGGIVAIVLETIAFLSYTNKNSILNRLFKDLRISKNLQFLNYINNDCKIAEDSITKLEKYKEKERIHDLSDDAIKWFYKHIDGSYEGGKGNWIFTPKKIEKQEGIYYSVIEYPTILRNSVPHSPVAFAPTALIAAGVCSTFLGITIGTSGADSNNLSKTGNILFSSLQHVFLTSLLGLLFATALIILIAVLTKQKEKYRNNLRKRLNDIAITLTSEKLLSTLNSLSSNNANQELGNVAKSLQALSADAIGAAVAKAMATHNTALLGEIKTLRQLQEQQGQTVQVLVSELDGKLIQPVVEQLERNSEIASAMSRSLTSENTVLLGEIKTLRQLQEQQGQTVQVLVSELDGKLIQPIVERLEQNSEIASAMSRSLTSENTALLGEIKTLRELQEQQGQTVQVLVSELDEKLLQPIVARLEESTAITRDASQAVLELKNELGGISQSLAGAVTTIQSFQQQTLKDLQQFANSLETTLQNFQGETKGVLEQVGIEINRSVAESIRGMEAQRTAFEESATQAASTFRGIREDLQLALTTQATEQKAMLDAITSQTQAILQEANSAFQSQSTTLQIVGVEAANLMDTAKENLNSTLTNIDTTLQNTRQTVQDELENFRIEYQASLNTFFDLQNNLLKETLGKQQDGLAKVVASLQQTFHDEAEKRQQMSQQVDESMANILNTTQKVNNMANALGLTSSERLGQLQELSRTIGDEAHRVETAYQSMTNQFEQALEKGNKELSGYLSNANESYSRYFNDFDFATAQVYKELNSTSGELLKAAQYLVVAADRQDNQEQN
jgi:hypothetical protein